MSFLYLMLCFCYTLEKFNLTEYMGEVIQAWGPSPLDDMPFNDIKDRIPDDLSILKNPERIYFKDPQDKRAYKIAVQKATEELLKRYKAGEIPPPAGGINLDEIRRKAQEEGHIPPRHSIDVIIEEVGKKVELRPTSPEEVERRIDDLIASHKEHVEEIQNTDLYSDKEKGIRESEESTDAFCARVRRRYEEYLSEQEAGEA